MLCYNYIKNVIFYQAKLFMFYNVQTTYSTYVGKNSEVYDKKFMH